MPAYSSGFTAFGFNNIGSSNPSFNVSGFMAAATNRLADAIRREAEIVKRALEGTTRTWSTPVDFTIDIDKSGDVFSMTVSTDSDIYRFVNDGTSIRYATMTKDFRPKSRPGSTVARMGRGGRLFVNKNIPRPGIEARNFIDTIADTNDEYFYRNMDRAWGSVVDEFWDKALSG